MTNFRRLFNQRGFSLVELIVTIVIIGILASVAVVNFGSNDITTKLAAAAKKARSDLQYAQDMAISSANAVKVVLEQQNNQYALQWEDGTPLPNIMGGGNFVVSFNSANFSGVSITDTDLPDGILVFRPPYGSPYYSDGVTELESVERVLVLNDQKSVKITPSTGRIFIDDE